MRGRQKTQTAGDAGPDHPGIREQNAFPPGPGVHPNFVTGRTGRKPVEPNLLLEKVNALLKAPREKPQPQ